LFGFLLPGCVLLLLGIPLPGSGAFAIAFPFPFAAPLWAIVPSALDNNLIRCDPNLSIGCKQHPQHLRPHPNVLRSGGNVLNHCKLLCPLVDASQVGWVSGVVAIQDLFDPQQG
jgi:hypothetical protein